MRDDFTADLRRAAVAIGKADTLVTLGHIGPDGDALGTALGIALAARRDGKKAYASFGEPFVVPGQFRFLDQVPLCSPGSLPDEIDVVVACDTADLSRLGSAAEILERAKTVVVLDHHRSNDGFGDITVIDPDAAATAQLAYYLLLELGWPVDASVATALHTGLVTDTGRFQYSVTTPEVLRVAAALVEAGATPEQVGRHVYEEAPFGYLKLAGTVLERTELDRERRLVWSVVLQSDLDAAGIGYEEADGLIDLIRIAEEAEVACLFKEVGKDTTKGSLRSRGEVDVGAIASNLGGGGHHNAAGFTVRKPFGVAVEMLRDQLS